MDRNKDFFDGVREGARIVANTLGYTTGNISLSNNEIKIIIYLKPSIVARDMVQE